MIGLFKITKIISQYVIAESLGSAGVLGRFYLPPLYREAVSTLEIGQEVFGVLDEASGWGAVLYKPSDGITDSNALNLNNDLNVGLNTNITGNLKVGGKISGKSTVNLNFVLTQEDCAAIIAGAVPGSAAVPVTVLAGDMDQL